LSVLVRLSFFLLPLHCLYLSVCPFFCHCIVCTSTYGSWLPLWYLQMAISTEVPGENHQPATSYWQTLSHNVVLSTPRHERIFNSQL
jgi:hypothetical protein